MRCGVVRSCAEASRGGSVRSIGVGWPGEATTAANMDDYIKVVQRGSVIGRPHIYKAF